MVVMHSATLQSRPRRGNGEVTRVTTTDVLQRRVLIQKVSTTPHERALYLKSVGVKCGVELKNRDFSVVTSEHCRILPVRYELVLVGLLCVMVSRVSGVRSPQPAEARILAKCAQPPSRCILSHTLKFETPINSEPKSPVAKMCAAALRVRLNRLSQTFVIDLFFVISISPLVA